MSGNVLPGPVVVVGHQQHVVRMSARHREKQLITRCSDYLYSGQLIAAWLITLCLDYVYSTLYSVLGLSLQWSAYSCMVNYSMLRLCV